LRYPAWLDLRQDPPQYLGTWQTRRAANSLLALPLTTNTSLKTSTPSGAQKHLIHKKPLF